MVRIDNNFSFPSSIFYGGSAGALAEAMGARTSCAQRTFGKPYNIVASQERRPPSPLRGTSPMKNGGRKERKTHAPG